MITSIAAVRSLCAALAAMTLAGCSTHLVSLDYQSPIGLQRDSSFAETIGVSRFSDERGTDADWLGAIRGGYGNPLKKLRGDVPVGDMVTTAFRQGLEARGMLAAGGARYELSGVIRKLDCSAYVNLESHVHLNVSLRQRASEEVVFVKSVNVDNTEGGWGAGIFGSVDQLRGLLEETLREAIDRVLSDPEFLTALSQ